MKLLTLNTHSWMEEQPLKKLDALVDTILKADYDIIALQEINQSIDAEQITDEHFITPQEERLSVPIKEDNFAYILVQKLKDRGLSYFWSWTANHIGYDMYDEGVAILCKVPFESEGHLVSKTTDYDSRYTRKVLKAQFARNGQIWTILSVHYSWWLNDEGEKSFQYEWDNTVGFIQADERENLIVMGDFNNDPKVENEGYSLVSQTAPFLKDAFEAAKVTIGEATVESAIDGWDGHTDDKRIDYVFVGQGLPVQSCQVVFDGKDAPVISDHFGVEVLIAKKLT